MKWYVGTIDEALNEYRQKNAILIVYIRGESTDENTNTFDNLWESFDESVFDGLLYISLRLDKDSKSTKQFSEFFPTPVFPVCYIIGLDGTPLDVVTAAEELSVDRLNNSLRKSIGLYNNQLNEKGIQSKSTENVSKNGSEEKLVGIDEQQKDASASSTTSLDQRIEYARKRLEEKRKEDEEKKKAEERDKEMSRRNEGKMLSELRERNKEKELKELAEARRRERQEDALALKKLREKIQSDRDERANRGKNTEIVEPLSTKKMEESAATKKAVTSDQCRIQCKFPNGTTLVKDFSSFDPLQSVIDAVKEDERHPKSFVLVQTYPRRQLTDPKKTLVEYDLPPSSALLVVSVMHTELLPKSTNYISLLFGIFYYPLNIVYRLIGSLFNFGRSNNNPRVEDRINTNKESNNRENSKDRQSNSLRREGNVLRLRTESDSSDTEKATWNGNSTQQL